MTPDDHWATFEQSQPIRKELGPVTADEQSL